MKILFLLTAIGIVTLSLPADDSDYFLIDDFSRDQSNFGTEWEGFTDQVMGGRSEMMVARVPADEESYIRMTGEVSLERNGGFIQIRLKFDERGGFDASEYRGVRLKVRGKDKGYYVFLRASYNIFPWKFYKAQFSVEKEWRYVEIPWTSFSGGDFGRTRKLDTKKLKSMAITAYGREFSAQLEVSEVGLYR